jgi:hypothetical protein
MTQISIGLRARLNLFNLAPVLLLALALLSSGCSKSPAANERADQNANTGNANQTEAAAQPPILQPTITGDIERASYAVSSARDAVKQKRWQDALQYLNNAQRAVDAALSRQPRLKEEFEALKSSIDRAVSAVEGRGNEAEARIAEVETRVGVIKLQSSGQ